MGYDLAKGEGLCFNQGRKLPLQPYVPKGKNIDYYNKIKHGLGYTSSEVEMNVLQEDSYESTQV